MKHNDTLCLRLPKNLYDQLRERAEAEERTMSGVVRLLVRRYLEEGRSDTGAS